MTTRTDRVLLVCAGLIAMAAGACSSALHWWPGWLASGFLFGVIWNVARHRRLR